MLLFLLRMLQFFDYQFRLLVLLRVSLRQLLDRLAERHAFLVRIVFKGTRLTVSLLRLAEDELGGRRDLPRA